MIFQPHKKAVRFLVTIFLGFLLAGVIILSCNRSPAVKDTAAADENLFPAQLVSFVPYEKNPLFTGTGQDTWDEKIRERGYILREADGYHMWYTGYREKTGDEIKLLGYATSPDGIAWTRYAGNPIFTENWVEDVMVVKHDSLYYMFAEGRNDVAHMLTSRDKIHWKDHGSLQIRQTNGAPLTPGPYGTPSVYIEGDVWNLFYERNDEGVWLATSKDLKEWKNVQDEPVLNMGPEAYDRFGVAVNQVIRFGHHYYAYYHGTPTKDWSEWNTNVAVSDDLVHWKKYPSNPILQENKSSGILVDDGKQYRLYSMHDQVQLHFPAAK
ncbi:MAG TPA: glycosylase [Chryseosolibacter sp.]